MPQRMKFTFAHFVNKDKTLSFSKFSHWTLARCFGGVLFRKNVTKNVKASTLAQHEKTLQKLKCQTSELEFACVASWEGSRGKNSTHSYSRRKNLVVTQIGENFFQEQFILVKLRHSGHVAKVIDIFVYLILKGKLPS